MEYLNIQQPFIYILLVLAIALAITGILYYRDTKFADKPKSLRYSFAVLRFIAISIIAFLLLEPFFKSIIEDVKKPIVIIAQDASESIGTNNSKENVEALSNQISSLSNDLSGDYDIKLLHFGEEVKTGLTDSFNQKATNFNTLFDYIDNQYQDLPVASMILLSDGIYNIGRNPVYIENISYPVYPVAQGDTLTLSDIAIKNIYYNPIAFLGDSLSIQFDISAGMLNGSKTNTKLEAISGINRKLLKKQAISITSNDYFSDFGFNTIASEKGTMHLRLSVDPVPGREKVTSNNYKDIFIEILDSKIKVLILANNPHPDISAIKQSLESNKNYIVSVSMAPDKTDYEDYDVIIFHSIPSSKHRYQGLFESLRRDKKPYFIIVGEQTDLAVLNQYQEVITLKANGANTNLAVPLINATFNAFELDNSTKLSITQLPPLTVPYGEFGLPADTKTLLNQKIGSVTTDYPLLAFLDRNGLKTGILLGEGIWLWRLNEFGRKGNQNSFNQLFQKSLQYLSIKEDKRKWQVKMDKNIWDENERIRFKAVLYNDNYESVNNSEAKMKLTHENGDQYDFTFTRIQDHYSLEAGYLPEGNYRFTAINNTPGQDLKFNGNLIVKALQIELTELQARHDILNFLANQTGGKLYYPDEFPDLERLLKEKEARKVIFTSESYVNLLNLKWIFFIILLLLSIEWFLRRYHGSY